MTDAFDYYELSVPDLQGGDPVPSVAASGAPQAKAKLAPSGDEVPPGDRKPLAESSDQAGAPAPNAKSGAAKAAGAKLLSCLGGSGSTEVSFAPALALSGHFATTISKYSVFGKDIPTGASLDMSVAATLSGAMNVKTSGQLSCSPNPDPVMVTIAHTPVPMSFYFVPTAQLTVGGAVEINNLGVAVTAASRSPVTSA